ncbi:40S ribosomal protein S8-like [Trematomus bernacchii]|uniref:40S ribosomal protein S8-like n=1 Tax=Trematomus bernacchii TaxID=40690 RepID=UPI00146C6BDB|nr:40S ribosomal protein S8-like [Trematomus bernacchii]
MGNAEDTDELIGKTGSGNKHGSSGYGSSVKTWIQPPLPPPLGQRLSTSCLSHTNAKRKEGSWKQLHCERMVSDNWHKRRKTGGKRKPYHKKRKYELGRPPANTKIGPRRIHTVRVRGGNKKYRALRLDVGNFSWGSECCTRKTRIIDVVYNASNNELVRTKTLVKNCIVLVDSLPYRQWYEAHFATPLGRKKGAKLTPEEEEVLNKKRSKRTQK